MNVLGKLKKIKDGTQYIYPMTHSDGVIVGTNMTLSEKLEPINGGFSAYVIELEKWGITQGIPMKPYQRIDFLKADANVKGINDALDYASQNGITEVILPKGDYAICYPREISMKSNLTLNGNGSRMKVIYDSDSPSPFYNNTGTDYYNFVGNVIVFGNRIKNAHLINLILEGCKYDRSFNNVSERAVETSYGVVFKESASFCSVKHCKISSFMGDGINFHSGAVYESVIGNKVLGTLDSTGQVIASANNIVAGFVTIPDGYDSFTFGNLGYNYLTTLNVKEIDVAFYKDDDTFIGKLSNRRIFTTISIPLGAKKLKMQFYNETDVTKDFMAVVKFGNPPLYCEAKYNEVFFGHRGGVQGGGSYTHIENNIIRDNGLASGTTFVDGKINFNDPTKYQFNQEDHFGDQTVIKGNVISGGYHGILIRCYNGLIEENLFYNLGGSAVMLYPIEFTRVSRNYFYRCGVSVNQMGSGFESSHVQVDNNSIHYSEMLVSNDTYVTSVHDNHFINSRITLGNNATFKNNHVKVTSAVVVGAGDTIIGGIVEDSTFYSNVLTPKLSYNIDADKMVNCKFNNIDVYSSKSSSSRLVTFERCRFNNSTMITRANTNDTTVRVTELNQCELIDTIVSLIYSSAGVSKSKASLKDCTIKAINNTSVFFVNSNGAQSVELYVENSKVSISSNLTSLFTFNYAVANTTTFTLKGSVIEYLGTTPLSTNYFADGGNNIYKSTIAGNIMKNIVFGTLTGSKYITYNPDTHSLSEPTSGYYAQGKLVHNAAPTSGGYLGWVTITEGFANNVSWAASTAYTVGQQVNANNKVYQCTVAGTSGSTAPSHSTGTATDGTVSPVTWMYMSPKAVFKTYGIISS